MPRWASVGFLGPPPAVTPAGSLQSFSLPLSPSHTYTSGLLEMLLREAKEPRKQDRRVPVLSSVQENTPAIPRTSLLSNRGRPASRAPTDSILEALSPSIFFGCRVTLPPLDPLSPVSPHLVTQREHGSRGRTIETTSSLTRGTEGEPNSFRGAEWL